MTKFLSKARGLFNSIQLQEGSAASVHQEALSTDTQIPFVTTDEECRLVDRQGNLVDLPISQRLETALQQL